MKLLSFVYDYINTEIVYEKSLDMISKTYVSVEQTEIIYKNFIQSNFAIMS